MDVGVDGFKIRNGLFIDVDLGHVGVVLGPEDHLIVPVLLKGIRHGEGIHTLGAVAAGKAQKKCHQQQKCSYFFHPLVPPLATPAMIFLWKIRKSTISGTEMTTTAAIMAGIFSRPKPFSRIS